MLTNQADYVTNTSEISENLSVTNDLKGIEATRLDLLCLLVPPNGLPPNGTLSRP